MSGCCLAAAAADDGAVGVFWAVVGGCSGKARIDTLVSGCCLAGISSVFGMRLVDWSGCCHGRCSGVRCRRNSAAVTMWWLGGGLLAGAGAPCWFYLMFAGGQTALLLRCLAPCTFLLYHRMRQGHPEPPLLPAPPHHIHRSQHNPLIQLLRSAPAADGLTVAAAAIAHSFRNGTTITDTAAATTATAAAAASRAASLKDASSATGLAPQHQQLAADLAAASETASPSSRTAFPTGIFVGVTVAGFVAVLAVLGGVAVYRKRRQDKQQQEAGPYNPMSEDVEQI